MRTIKSLQIISGHYGSGKTEVAINYALFLRRQGHEIVFADLDIVNPYFRSTERKELLAQNGIELISTSLEGRTDLPALPGDVNRLFLPTEKINLIDLGGDPIGARVLARYRTIIKPETSDFFCVFNANRPETATPEQALRSIEAIQQSSGQRVTALIANTHLCAETTAAEIIRGYDLALKLSEMSGLPLEYVAVARQLIPAIAGKIATEILPLDLYMKKPWEV